MGTKVGGKYVIRQVCKLMGRQVDRHAKMYVAKGWLQKQVDTNTRLTILIDMDIYMS